MRAALYLCFSAAGLCACTSGMFRRPAAKGPPPTPAASPNNIDRDPAPILPLALAQSDDYVVRLVAGSVTCSGTLIAEDRVLTAHHCVSARNRSGEVLGRNVDPASIRVELGGDYLPWGEVGVRAVVAPPCGYASGTGDLAVLVLKRRLIGVATIAPDLDHAPKIGEAIDPVGFGRCALSSDGIRRKHRAAGSIQRVAGDGFELEASICPGDSGGPALTRGDGAVIGVISASVMDGSEQTEGPSEFTRIDRWRGVFANAELIAQGTSAAELPPVAGCPANRR
jgi:Trypsin